VIIQHFLAFADLFIGGGGTMNTEACYFGTPTISTRSFISHYDKFQIDNQLMFWVHSKAELLDTVNKIFGKRNNDRAREIFDSMSVEIDLIVEKMVNNV
jgi:predicted glycosyltransferase